MNQRFREIAKVLQIGLFWIGLLLCCLSFVNALKNHIYSAWIYVGFSAGAILLSWLAFLYNQRNFYLKAFDKAYAEMEKREEYKDFFAQMPNPKYSAQVVMEDWLQNSRKPKLNYGPVAKALIVFYQKYE